MFKSIKRTARAHTDDEYTAHARMTAAWMSCARMNDDE